MFVQTRLRKNAPNPFFGGSVEGVNVLLDCALEEERRLRNDRNVLPQRVQSHLKRVELSNLVLRTDFGFDDAEDRLNNRGLPRPRSTHDSNFGVFLHFEAEFLDD